MGESGEVLQVTHFLGGKPVNLDDKSRLPVPSDLRDQIPEGVVKLAIIKGLDGCLFVYAANDIQQLTSRFSAGKFLSQAKARKFQRQLFHGASVVEIDGQGRIPLNPIQVEHAGLEKKAPVVVVGNLNRIEIWNPERYETQIKEDEEDGSLEDLAAVFFAQELEG